MEQLTISNDWLPVDQWIAETLDKSVPASQVEADLVDCVLFWSSKHSTKGTSSRDSLAKSLEAVRILVSLGIEYHSAGLRGDRSSPARLRDHFKAPFTRLKTLESRTPIETILGMEANPKTLSGYWKSESKERIDNRLYAMVRKNYDNAVAEAILTKELRSILDRLIRITGFPRQMDEHSSVSHHIRTILAMHLNRIKRPTSLRRVMESTADSYFKGFEPLTKAELKKMLGNASLTGSQKMKIDFECNELIQQLDVSDDLIQWICAGYTGSWADYISLLWSKAVDRAAGDVEEGLNKNGKKIEIDPLSFFESDFIVDQTFLDAEIGKSQSDRETFEDLQHIFSEMGVEYSRKDLDLARGAMPKKELDAILRTAVKKGFVSSRNEAGKKLYILKTPKSDECR